MAHGDEAAARKVFANEEDGDAYDAGVEITSTAALVDRIQNGFVKEDGRKVSDVFQVEWKDVDYRENTSNVEDGIRHPSALVKRPKYAEQLESRVVLYPLGRELADAVTIVIDDPGACLEKMFSADGEQKTVKPAPAFDLDTQIQNVHKIREIVRRLQAVRTAQLIEPSARIGRRPPTGPTATSGDSVTLAGQASAWAWAQESLAVAERFGSSLEREVVPLLKQVYGELRKNGYGNRTVDDAFRHYRPRMASIFVMQVRDFFEEIAPAEHPSRGSGW
jgi:hypothetical protein